MGTEEPLRAARAGSATDDARPSPGGVPTASPGLPPPAGRALLLARVGCVVVAALAVGLFVASLPIRWGRVITLDLTDFVTLERADLPLDLYFGILLGRTIAVAVGFCAIGALIAWRRWDDPFALFVSLTLILYSTQGEAVPPTDGPASAVVYLLSAAASSLFFAFLLVFPDGRFVPRWTVLVVPPIVLTAILWYFPPSFPLAVANWPPALNIAVQGIGWGSALYAQVHRYRRVSDGTQRRQTRWVVVGVVAAITGILAYVLISEIFAAAVQPGTIAFLAAVTLYSAGELCIPLSIGVAILRANLFDIDVIINRALVYGALTGTLALVYFGGVAGLGAAARTLTGQEASQLAIVASTLAVAALFQPLRRRLQHAIDRRFYRRKYDAAQTIARFAATARDETDLDGLTTGLLGTVEETMQPAHVSLWLRPTDRERR